MRRLVPLLRWAPILASLMVACAPSSSGTPSNSGPDGGATRYPTPVQPSPSAGRGGVFEGPPEFGDAQAPMPITDAGKDAEGGPPDGSTDGSSLASLCPGTNAQGTLGPELKGTLVLPLTLDKRLDSVLLNGSSGDLCPLGSTGTGFTQPNTHGYLSSIQANSGFVTLVNATSEEIRASAVFDCPKQYTETGMAFYRGTKAPTTKSELVGCVGRVDAKMETECASLETTKSIVLKPCETVTVMVQNTTSVPLPKLGVYWEPTSRQ